MFSQECTPIKKFRRENAVLDSSSSPVFHPVCYWYQCSIRLAARCGARISRKNVSEVLMLSYEEKM